MECLHSRPFLYPQCEKAQLLSEAVLSGCELGIASPREAEVLTSLKFGETLIIPHLYFKSVAHKG